MRLQKRVGLFAAAASLGLAAACDSMLTRPSLYHSLPVDVVRRDGEGVPGATLVLYTGARQMDIGTSGANGHHTFERVPQGEYGVRVESPKGFVPLKNLVPSAQGEVVDGLRLIGDSTPPAVRFTLLAVGTGRIVVKLREPGGAPISGASVTLYDPARVNATAATGADGVVSFDSVAFGVHGVSLNRPVFYRDFVRLQDSLYASRDNIITEKDRTDSVTFVLTRCAGTVDVQVVDDAGAPVPGTVLAFFTPTDALGTASTGANGHGVHAGPCATQIGVSLEPPAGYSASGRGSAFTDGITVKNGATVPVTLRVQRTP